MTETEGFFALLRHGLRNTPLPSAEPSVWEPLLPGIFAIARKQNCSPIIAYALLSGGLAPDETDKLVQMQGKAMLVCEGFRFALAEMERVFTAASIPFLPMKGALLRDIYPQDWMRTSGDLDVLVPEDRIDTASALLQQELGYTYDSSSTYDKVFRTPAGQLVELHHSLLEKGRLPKAEKELSALWERSLPGKENPLRRELTGCDFAFYHIVHMAKHFQNGGIGVRFFVDLFLIEKSLSPQEIDRFLALTEQCGLRMFTESALDVCATWLEGQPPTPAVEVLERFVLKGSVFGSTANRVALQQARKGKNAYWVSRVFQPKSVLAQRYPVLDNHPVLLPLMQVRRWLSLLKPDGRSRAKAEWILQGKQTASEKSDARLVCEILDLP